MGEGSLQEEELLLVLDYGSDHLQQLVERLRAEQVNYLVKPGTLTRDEVLDLHPDRIVVAGKPPCSGSDTSCPEICDPLELGLPTQCTG